MTRYTSSRKIVATLLAAGLASYMAIQQSALSEICLREVFRPVHTKCDLAGADSDAHLDRRECHSVPILFLENQRLFILPVSVAAKRLPSAAEALMPITDSTTYWLELVLENSAPRAPPINRAQAASVSA